MHMFNASTVMHAVRRLEVVRTLSEVSLRDDNFVFEC